MFLFNKKFYLLCSQLEGIRRFVKVPSQTSKIGYKKRINFSPMTHFYIPWKCQKTRFSDVFQGYANRSLGEIGSIDCDLNMYSSSIFLNYISILILTWRSLAFIIYNGVTLFTLLRMNTMIEMIVMKMNTRIEMIVTKMNIMIEMIVMKMSVRSEKQRLNSRLAD